MTDERVSETALIQSIERLPLGAGIVFRHYSLPVAERRRLFERVRRLARRRRLMLLLADEAQMAIAWGSDGFHSRKNGGGLHRRLLQSAPAHDLREIRQAERAGAELLFVSPLFPTRSHPGGRTLGRTRFGLIARQAQRPVIALGGMTAQRARHLQALGAYGWAAIDALSGTAPPRRR